MNFINDLQMPTKNVDLSAFPASYRAKMEMKGKAWTLDSERREHFKNHFPEIYKNVKLENHKISSHMNCIESLGENNLILKQKENSIRFNSEKNRYEPVLAEGLNSTADITNWAYIQMPLLRQIYFENPFINLVSVQPAMSSTGTFYKMDIVRPEDIPADTSVFTKGDFEVTYGDYTEGGAVNSLKLKLTNDSFSTTARALSAEVTDMLQQDLSAEHGMDAFREIMPFVVSELAKIESTMLLNGVLAESANFSANLTWDKAGGLADDITTTFGTKSYLGTIVDKINEAGREIQKNVGVQPNWVYMNVDTWGIFEDALNTVFKDAYTNSSILSLTGASIENLGRDNKSASWKGVIAGKYDVYVDNSGHAGLVDKILVGSTSNNWLYQGMVYIPFILGYAPGRMRSYDKIFQQKEGMLNRSGFKMINAKFYAMITIQNA
jgi:hypothetical protein